MTSPGVWEMLHVPSDLSCNPTRRSTSRLPSHLRSRCHIRLSDSFFDGVRRRSSNHLPPTWTAGRLVPSGSASRKTSWVTGAVSPSPKSRNRNRYTIGLPSVHPK